MDPKRYPNETSICAMYLYLSTVREPAQYTGCPPRLGCTSFMNLKTPRWNEEVYEAQGIFAAAVAGLIFKKFVTYVVSYLDVFPTFPT